MITPPSDIGPSQEVSHIAFLLPPRARGAPGHKKAISAYWNIGILEYRPIGILGYWDIGILEYWNIGMLGFGDFELLEYWNAFNSHAQNRTRSSYAMAGKGTIIMAGKGYNNNGTYKYRPQSNALGPTFTTCFGNICHNDT